MQFQNIIVPLQADKINQVVMRRSRMEVGTTRKNKLYKFIGESDALKAQLLLQSSRGWANSKKFKQ